MTQQVSLFEGLAPDVVIELRAAEERIRLRLRRSAEDIVAIGMDLITVKNSLPHGQFTAWLQANFEMSDQTARNFMQVAETFGKSQTVLDLPPTVLYSLAAPSTQPEVRDAAVRAAESGESVTIKQVDEWKRQIDAAKRKAADAEEEARKARQQTEFDREQALAEIRQLRSDLSSTDAERQSLDTEIKRLRTNPPTDIRAQETINRLLKSVEDLKVESEKQNKALKIAEGEAERFAQDLSALGEERDELKDQLDAVLGQDPKAPDRKFSDEEIAALNQAYAEKAVLHAVETKASLAIGVTQGLLQEVSRAKDLSPERWKQVVAVIDRFFVAVEQIRTSISGEQNPKIVSLHATKG